MTKKKQKVLVEHDFDWSRINGADLNDAALYLTELAKKHPGAVIDEHWTGYEDMTIRLVSYRDETDNEYTARLKLEAEKTAWAKKVAQEEKAREDRRKVYQTLKREFG